MPDQRSEKKRLSLGCLGEILAMVGVAAFFGIPQLRPLVLRLSGGGGYTTDPFAGGWAVLLGVWPGFFLLFAGLSLVVLDRIHNRIRKEQDDEPPRPKR